MDRDSPSVVPGVPKRAGRRTLLRLAFAVSAYCFLSGHAPYGQWNVYRKRNLLILTSRSDAPSFPLGERVAKVLAAHLPESRAQVSRAPDTRRIASLISTAQMDVAVLSRRDAASLRAGRAPFEEFGPVALRTLVALDGYRLICREDFPDRHAYLVTATLSDNRAELGVDTGTLDVRKPEVGGDVPIHAGAAAFFDGRPPPQD